jgi:alpha-1,2-mannosyltransferase
LFVALLRDAPWLTHDRVRGYSTILILAGTAMIAWTLTGPGSTDPMGRTIGTDFVSFWTVSWALLNGHQHAIYNPEALAGLEQAIAHPARTAFYPWEYPPTALLFVYPLALLPYLWSLALWLAVGAVGYLTAMWRILPRPLTLWAGLAYPAVLLTIGHGQNGLMTTGLLGWGLLLLPRYRVSAGIMFGILGFKPQLALLVPVALIAGGQWRTLTAAGLTFVGLSGLTVIVFGASVWHGFYDSLFFASRILESGLFPYYKVQSAFAATRLLGGSPTIALTVQILTALAAAVILIMCWRYCSNSSLKNAALAAAIPLATPYLLDYDLMIVALAMAWLVQAQRQDHALAWEGTALAVSALVPLVSRTIAAYTHVLLAPFAVAALFAVIVFRIKGDHNSTLPPFRLHFPWHLAEAISFAAGRAGLRSIGPRARSNDQRRIGDPADSGCCEGSPDRGHASGAARKSPIDNFAGASFAGDHAISPINLSVLRPGGR